MLCKESPETDFRNKCGLNLGQEPGPANLRVALTSLQAMDLPAALTGEQGGVFEGWGLAGLLGASTTGQGRTGH